MPQIIISSLTDKSIGKTAFPMEGANLLDELQKLSPDCFGGLSHDIYLNRELLVSVDPDSDGELIDKAIDFQLGRYDRVDVHYRPAGLDPFSWAVIAIAALSLAVSLSMRPDTPGNSGEGTSPNNKLNAATNEFRPNEAVPQIFGSPTAYPDFIQPSHYVYEDNVKIIREMFCIGEGHFQIDRILSGETDFDEIPNSSATVYPPGQIPPPEQRIIVRSTSEARGQGNIPLPAPNDKSTSYTGDFDDVVASGQDSIISLIDTCNLLQDTQVKVGDFLECVIFQLGQTQTDILRGVYEIGAIDDASTPKTITVLETGGAEKNPNLGTASGSIEHVQEDGTSLNYIGWFTIPGTKNTSVFFNSSMPSGIRSSDGGWLEVSFEMEIEQIDENGQPIPGGHTDLKTHTFAGATSDQQYKTTYFDNIPEGIYRGRAKRLTNNYENAQDQVNLENINGVEQQTDPDYGEVTLLYTERRADPLSSESGSSKTNVHLTRMLPTWGDSTLRPARSFADAIYWLFCVKAGYPEDMIDLESLYYISNNLPDERLGYFDYTFDDKNMGLASRLEVICNAARCVFFKSYGKISFNRIEKKDFHSEAYTRRDVNGPAKTTMRARLPTDRNSISMTYVSQPDNVEKTIYRSVDSSGQIVDVEGTNPDEFKLLGCQDDFQAENRIDYEIRRLLYQNRTAELPILFNGLNSQKGDRVRWADIYDFAMVDGEILDIGENGIYYTSEEFNPETGKTYYVQITDDQGMPGAQLLCTPVPGAKKAFQAQGASGAYLADRDIIQKGSCYVIAAEEDIEWSDWTLVSTTQEGDGKTIMLGLENYTDRIFEKD